MMMHRNKAPSELRHIHVQTFTHTTLVCYEISVNCNRLKGQKNVGTSRYFWPKLTNMRIFCGVMPKNGRHQHTEQKKGIFMTLLWVNEYFVMRIVTTIKDKNIIIRPPS